MGLPALERTGKCASGRPETRRRISQIQSCSGNRNCTFCSEFNEMAPSVPAVSVNKGLHDLGERKNLPCNFRNNFVYT
jgi:hypothetical protein